MQVQERRSSEKAELPARNWSKRLQAFQFLWVVYLSQAWNNMQYKNYKI